MEIVNCQICGAQIENRSGARKYCSKCRRIKDKELQRIKDKKQKDLRSNKTLH